MSDTKKMERKEKKKLTVSPEFTLKYDYEPFIE